MEKTNSSYKIFGQFGMLVVFNLLMFYVAYKLFTFESSSGTEPYVVYGVVIVFLILFLTLLMTQCRYYIADGQGITVINPVLPFLRRQYRWEEFDYYTLCEEYSKSGTYEAIWLVKDRKLEIRISEAYYSNYPQLKASIKVPKRRKKYYGKTDQLFMIFGWKRLKEESILTRRIASGEVRFGTQAADEKQEEDFFWDVIRKSTPTTSTRNEDDVTYQHINNIIRHLSDGSIEQQLIFEKVLQRKLNQLYTPEIAELYTIAEGRYKIKNGQYFFWGMDKEDTFMYFRCWLILKGETFVNDIRADIQSYVRPEYSNLVKDEPVYADELLLAAERAYSAKHPGSEDDIRDAVYSLYPQYSYEDDIERGLSRQPRAGTALQEVYPKLVSIITKQRQ